MNTATADLKRKLGHFIGGQAVQGASGRSAPIYDPATGAVQATVALASAEETQRAIADAASALPGWAATTPLRRARVLFAFKQLLEQHADELAYLISSEHGKVLADARGELTRGIEVVEFACGIPHLLKGEMSEQVGTGVDSWSLRQPLGVCAGITPFNFPAMVPLWMFPIALAAGNTFVLKPSEKDPGCALRMAELLLEAGLPAGAFNVINGDRGAVDTLLTDPRVQAVSFVGSTPVARHVYTLGCESGKRVQALGGAKNHMVVMPDADLEHAVPALLGAAFGSAGERCMAISVALAVGSVGDELVGRLVDEAAALKVGPGRDPQAGMGPLVTAEHLARVCDYVRRGEEEGARLVLDGRGIAVEGHEHGFFLGPCVFDHVSAEMEIYREEIFGPVLCVMRVPDLETALERVCNHRYGNGVSLFTRDGATARAFARRVEAGMVGINVAIPVPMAFHSFGGWKESLFGPLHMHGPDGVRFYTRTKTVTARWPEGDIGGPEFHMPIMK